MASISIKFYTVKMPDGKEYACSGKSIKSVAKVHNVPAENVKVGADTLRIPDISKYYFNRVGKEPDLILVIEDFYGGPENIRATRLYSSLAEKLLSANVDGMVHICAPTGEVKLITSTRDFNLERTRQMFLEE